MGESGCLPKHVAGGLFETDARRGVCHPPDEPSRKQVEQRHPEILFREAARRYESSVDLKHYRYERDWQPQDGKPNDG